MYCGAAVPEKCVGNGSYFKKKKVWIFFSLFLSKSLPRGRDVATDTAEYTTMCTATWSQPVYDFSRTFPHRSQSHDRGLIGLQQTSHHIRQMDRFVISARRSRMQCHSTYHSVDSVFADSLKQVGFSRYRIEYQHPQNIRVRCLVTHRSKKKL